MTASVAQVRLHVFFFNAFRTRLNSYLNISAWTPLPNNFHCHIMLFASYIYIHFTSALSEVRRTVCFSGGGVNHTQHICRFLLGWNRNSRRRITRCLLHALLGVFFSYADDLHLYTCLATYILCSSFCVSHSNTCRRLTHCTCSSDKYFLVTSLFS